MASEVLLNGVHTDFEAERAFASLQRADKTPYPASRAHELTHRRHQPAVTETNAVGSPGLRSFLDDWLWNPGVVAQQAPSSRILAREMVRMT